MPSVPRKRKSPRVSERRLVDVLIRHLREQATVVREVPHFEKRIDIVAYPECASHLKAIEAKLSDWQRALQQALLNQTAAEKCYIAIWTQHVHRVDVEQLRLHGIGLFAVGSRWGDVELIHEADQSPYLNRMVNDRIRDHLTTGA